MSCRLLLSGGPVLCCHSLPVQPSPVFSLHLSLRLPALDVLPCLGKEAGQKPRAREKPLAVHHSPQCQTSDVRWLCLPGSVDIRLAPTVLLAPLFLSSRCFRILSHCVPSTFFQVHFCICFGQDSIIRGCHVFLQETVSCTAGRRGLIGKVLRCQGFPPVYSDPSIS